MAWLFLFGPLALFLWFGLLAADKPGTKRSGLVGAATLSTAAWLAFVAGVPHTEGSASVFGTEPFLSEEDSVFWLLLAAFVLVSAGAGALRVGRPLAIGAAVVVGPSALAYWTTPQGDGDGLWALIFLYLPVFGVIAAAVAGATSAIAGRGEATELDSSAVFARRFSAFVLDLVLVLTAIWFPVELFDDAAEVVFALAVPWLYLAVMTATLGATCGQLATSLRVVAQDGETTLQPWQAALRSALIIAVVVVSGPFLGLPALAELAIAGFSGPTLVDRVCRTRVVARHTTQQASANR